MKEFLLMLALLNPFSQILYLSELMNRSTPRQFANVHLRASLLSLAIFGIFGIWGERILNDVFQVRLGSLQIFGGLIMLYLAHGYITRGAGSNLMFRGDISDLAPNISLPYMVGPGTIWVSILIGRGYSTPIGLGMIACVLAINFAIVFAFMLAVHTLRGTSETRLDKYLGIFMRLNGLFIGGVGVEMILNGIQTTLLVRP